ncbi:ABC transporter, inner membrane subunit [Syntrophobacter sp. SbD1]|nr:ABC transporter, inner membrane subunit [Syntrophobacter sp. SbD1]
MLNQFITDPMVLRAAQAAGAAILALMVAYLARRADINMQREAIVSLVRGISQIVIVGLLLTIVLGRARWLSAFVLLAMTLAGAAIAARRTKQIPGILQVTMRSIVLGAGLVIGIMVGLEVIDRSPATLIPVGSMIIANAMNTTALALDRFRAEVEAHTGQIEAGLALGAASTVVVAPYLKAAVQAGMIPSVNNLRSLGIVWIPGVMAGMVLAGTDPIEAAIYQFVVVAMLFATAGTTALLCTLFVRSHAFSAAEQLTLRMKA